MEEKFEKTNGRLTTVQTDIVSTKISLETNKKEDEQQIKTIMGKKAKKMQED